MSRFENQLWSELVREHGDTVAKADRRDSVWTRAARHRLLAGGTLGVAGIAAAAVLALGIVGGSTASPAFAVSQKGDGSVSVALASTGDQNLPELNAKLAQMGLDEGVTIWMVPGAATTPGPVTCAQGPGATTPVDILVGENGTETITADSTTEPATGSFHLDHCLDTGDSDGTASK
jgi:hypothetical protein